MRIISRSEAKQHGLLRYYTGAPCKNGHDSERLTSNGSCLECSRLDQHERHRNGLCSLQQEEHRRKNRHKINAQKREKREKADPDLPARKRRREIDRENREEAHQSGQSVYTSSAPCKLGHEPLRYVNDNKCVTCVQNTNRRKHNNKKRSCNESGENRKPARQSNSFKSDVMSGARNIRLAQKRQSKQARDHALGNGLKFYWSILPCPHNHIGWRRASNGLCRKCEILRSRSTERREYEKEYYANNKLYVLQRSREYQQKHRDYFRELSKRRNKQHPEQKRKSKRAYKHRRRAANGGHISTADQQEWEKRQKKKCYWCGQGCSKNYEVDHYIPLSHGGQHRFDNLVISCPRCNRVKSSRDPYEFARECGRLL